MKIGERILVVMVGAFIGGGIALFVVFRFVILKGFDRIEAEESRQEIRKVQALIADDLDRLARTGADYGSWEDTYDFIADLDPEYVAFNMGDSTLTGLKVHAMVFVRQDHRVAYAKAVDSATGRDRPAPAGLLARIEADPRLTTHANEAAWNSGLLALPEGPMLFAAVPITHSNDRGPIRGSFVIARFLDEEYLRRAERILDLTLHLAPWSGGADARVPPAARALAPGRPVAVAALDGQRYGGYLLLEDAGRAPAYVLEVVTGRDIHREGELTIRYVVAGLVAVSLLGIGGVLLLLRRFVLERMDRIRLQVSRIGEGDPGVKRILVEGRDELAVLARVIDEAFASKRAVEEQLREGAEQLERRVRERTTELAAALGRVRELDLFKEEILRGMTGGLCVFDGSGRILLLNPAGQELFRAGDDAVGRTLEAVLGAPLAAALARDLAEGRERASFTDILVPDGQGRERTLSYALSIVRFGPDRELEGIAHLWDRTEERRRETEARRLERLAALGEVATQIAHELRNPLTAMYSTMQYLVRDLQGEAREMGGIVLENMERMTGIIGRMGQLARDGSGERRPVDLGALAGEVLELLAPALRERGVTLRAALPPDPVRVFGDDVELRQIVLNLLTNAMQAMPAGGELDVALEAERVPGAAMASLTVADRGPGIDPRIRGRVFDPFFTSKERGTGLGLAIVERIVRAHGGTISFAARPGGGTTFVVELPLVPEE